jgi:hypothetical protein
VRTEGASRLQSPKGEGVDLGKGQRVVGVERKSFVNCRVNNKKVFVKNMFGRHKSEV